MDSIVRISTIENVQISIAIPQKSLSLNPAKIRNNVLYFCNNADRFLLGYVQIDVDEGS